VGHIERDILVALIMARPRRVAAKRTVEKVKEQLAGDEDLKEYNVKSEDTNESSSGIFLFNSVTMFLVFLRGFSPWWPPSLLSPSFLTTF
jgi:hypothetical protein